MENNNKKTGVMGVGMVGGALAKFLDKPLLYDKYKNIGSLEELNKADIIFICVPTPYKEDIGFDYSCIEEALSNIKGNKTIVIKSTVLPGTTQKMQDKYPQHKILFNPEFLQEKTAIEDMKNPYEQIVGYTNLSRDLAEMILKILPKAENEFIVSSGEAEMVKYFSNTFLATKVVFANQVYDLCQKLGLDYDSIKKMAKVSPRFAFSHFDVWTDGYRGYSGHCLPKDTKSLIRFANENGIELGLLKKADEINDEIIKNNEKSEKQD
ncbi:MAG: hypothetical protein NTW46_03695 [Candidatus Nealsonbacteria bacterium]|nr:hypothetical protein [Candidatus Nealsonbacteria bacterium]